MNAPDLLTGPRTPYRQGAADKLTQLANQIVEVEETYGNLDQVCIDQITEAPNRRTSAPDNNVPILVSAPIQHL